VTEIATTQPETGHANGAPTGSSEATGPAKSGFQKRIDKLVREKFEALADLERALKLVERYKVALRAARSANHG